MTKDLPGGPILVHAGDVSSRGYNWEIRDFMEWFSSLPYTHKIFIPGNHDFFFDWSRYARTPQGKIRHGNSQFTKEKVEEMLSQFPNVYLLNDSGVTVENIKFWGSPITPWFHDWAFNRWENEIGAHWDLIPEDTDVLITHGPPHKILDRVIRGNSNVGCPILTERVKAIKPKIHVFGHIHEDHGVVELDGTTYVNASMLDVRYDYSNKPTVIDFL